MLNVLTGISSADYWQGFNRRAASSSPFFVASGVSRIICLRRAFEKLRKIREFEPTHVGCYVMVDELDAALQLQRAKTNKVVGRILSRYRFADPGGAGTQWITPGSDEL
jgi:hypothetical protein